MDKDKIISLVKQAKNKDSHAFALLYEMVYEDLYKMALYTLGNQEDAEDIVSETVLDAYKGIASLRDETAFRGWIFKILSNKCKTKIAKYVKIRENESAEALDDMIVEPSAKDNTEDEVLNSELVRQAFSAITYEERLIVTMVVYAGLDSKEISKQLKLNRNTVRSKYNRALAKMQEALEGRN
ncbi:MAG: RNA polymerase sigma factor [Lachnospiraceae bacterium]|nr:RNA polymerase sigma factor [Lachnospiraceae bacterium]